MAKFQNQNRYLYGLENPPKAVPVGGISNPLIKGTYPDTSITGDNNYKSSFTMEASTATTWGN